MFEYSICNVADEEIFHKQCESLRKHIPDIQQKKILRDVDNSLICVFNLDGKRLYLCNDKNINAIYINSEFDLEKYFS